MGHSMSNVNNLVRTLDPLSQPSNPAAQPRTLNPKLEHFIVLCYYFVRVITKKDKETRFTLSKLLVDIEFSWMKLTTHDRLRRGLNPKL
jgi:hypothetical protein